MFERREKGSSWESRKNFLPQNRSFFAPPHTWIMEAKIITPNFFVLNYSKRVFKNN
jgi:hypothetical protein